MNKKKESMEAKMEKVEKTNPEFVRWLKERNARQAKRRK